MSLKNASIIGFFSIPPPSLAEQNPTAYNNAISNLPLGAGSCSHCGRGLVHHVVIRDESGIQRFIGTDCAAKIGFDRNQIADRITDEEKARRDEAREKRIAETDWSVFTFGKYQGRKVADVFAIDPNYIQFIAENDIGKCPGKAATRDLCKQLWEPVKQRRDDAAAIRARDYIDAIGRDIVADIAKGGCGCYEARQLLDGHSDFYTALRVASIAAYLYGTKRSKAYKTAYESMESALVEADNKFQTAIKCPHT